jgi:uncharacterized Zn-finger protein
MKNQESFRKHVKRIHPEQADELLKIKCTICSMDFHKPSDFEEHMLLHDAVTVNPKTSPESLTCSECGKTCKSDRALKKHKDRAHSLDPRVCTFCQESLQNLYMAEEHMMEKHSEQFQAVKYNLSEVVMTPDEAKAAMVKTESPSTQ